MDEQNKYLEENKSLIENKIHINENSHCDGLIKDVKEECILYDRIPGYLEENQQEIFQTYNDINKQKVNILLSEISSLSPKERLLLYFKVPGGQSDVDPLRQHQNPLGTRLEINRTINWIKSHLEHDPEVSIPKQDVYNDYCVFCKNSNIKPLSTADFGKVMKQVFPNVKPRRLGTRGNSRYCYAAMRKVTKLTPPHITVTDNNIQKEEFFEEIDKESWTTIKKWFEEITHSSFNNIKELAKHIETNNINPVAPSKMILQRKYMQRYNNKKKFPDLNVKRKKKRKRKNSLNTDTVVPACISPVTLKVEEFSDSNNSFNSSAAVLPMNLAIDNPDIQKSNHSSIYNDSDMNQSSMEGTNLKNISSGVELFEQKIIKEDKSENLQFNSVHDILAAEKNSLNLSNQNLLQRNHDESNLMGPPQFHPNTELYTTNINLRKRLILEQINRNLNKDSTGGGNEGEIGNDDKDVLLQNLGLPRERVISICNMDKHELDDYLPNIENPDEQDAELLQYFQVPEPSAQKTDETSHTTASLIECKSETATNLSITSVYPENNLPQTKITDEYNTVKTLNFNKKSAMAAATYPSEYYSNNKNNSSLIYTRENESLSSIYSSSNLDQRNLKGIGPNCGSYSSTRNRYNFVPITSKVNSNLNTRPIVNANNSYTSYSTRIYNPTISASAPTSPNILKQKNIPCYSFDNVEKYENIQMQNVMDPLMKINSNESLEFRSRSVPLNGPKIEEIDNNQEYNISECQSVVQTPIPHEFNDFNELINGPESLDATLNPIRTSHNIYIPQLNNDLQNISKKTYDHFAQKYNTMNKNTITRSNPATPLPVMSSSSAATNVNKNSLINNFELNLIKQHSNKMFDLSKSVPTTPIESSAEPNIFRFSPDIKSNSLIGVDNPNSIDLKKQRNICSASRGMIGPSSTTNINLNGLNLLENDSAAEILNNL